MSPQRICIEVRPLSWVAKSRTPKTQRVLRCVSLLYKKVAFIVSIHGCQNNNNNFCTFIFAKLPMFEHTDIQIFRVLGIWISRFLEFRIFIFWHSRCSNILISRFPDIGLANKNLVSFSSWSDFLTKFYFWRLFTLRLQAVGGKIFKKEGFFRSNSSHPFWRAQNGSKQAQNGSTWQCL